MNKPIDYLSARRYVGVWNNIASSRKFLCGLGIRIHDLFNIKIMSGNNTLFWYDHWIGSSNLKTRYPDLFDLESKKRCTVADRIGDRNQNWKWKSRPSAQGLDSEVHGLGNEVSNVQLNPGLDQWRCKLSADGKFSVAIIR